MQEVYSAAKADNAEELWTMLEATPGFDKNAKNAVIGDRNNYEYTFCISLLIIFRMATQPSSPLLIR